MRKKIAIIFCVIFISAVLLGACAMKESKDTSTPGPAPDNDASIVVAEVNGEPIYKDKFNAMLSNVGQQYGFTEEMLEGEAAQGLATSVLESLVTDKVTVDMLKEKGYTDLTDEQMAQVEQSVEYELTMITDMEAIMAELGEDYTEEELQEKIDAYQQEMLSSYGITRQELTELYMNNVAYENARADLVGDITPSEEQIRTYYDEQAAADQAQIGDDITIYESIERDGATPFYAPAGIRKVRHILIKLDDDKVNEIYEMRGQEDDAGADALLEESLVGIQERADEVLAKLKTEEIMFDDAIKEYNDDPGMEYYPQGYTVAADSAAYVESFTQGAMSLENIGDFTDLIVSDYGYHIIEYTSDVPEGPIDFDSVKEQINDTLQPALQNEAWVALVDAYKEDIDIVYYYENI